ncbi:MAG: hypothetical protein K0B10_15550 [Vicingaceae bacterium]|nr:hypothetical protein [Vicingaceae bacterium]
MNSFKIYSILIFILINKIIYAQLLFYQDVFYGGSTGGGFSTGLGTGSGIINLYIEPNSTIKKAFLICQRFQNPPPAQITINGLPYIINNNSEVSSYSILNSGHTDRSGVHVLDITTDINPNQSNYNITIPPQTGNPEKAFNSIYLLILYENIFLPKTSINLIVKFHKVVP